MRQLNDPWRFSRSSATAFHAASAVLLVAGFLKGAFPNDQPGFELFRGQRAYALFAVASYEVALAWWLLSGVKSTVARRVAILTFSGFAVVSFWNGLQGERSCGCLGPVHTSPWFMCAIDLAVVTLLWRSKPQPLLPGDAVVDTATRIPARTLVCFGLLIVSLMTIHQVGRGLASASVASSPVEIQLGPLAAGGSASAPFVGNRSARNGARIASVQTSCPCLHVRFDATPLDSAGPSMNHLSGQVFLDMAKEPDFVGRLHIRATGLDDQGRPVCSLSVRAEVAPNVSDSRSISNNHL